MTNIKSSSQRAYVRRLVVLMAIYVIAVLGGAVAQRAGVLNDATTVLVASVSGLCIAGVFWAIGRLIVGLEQPSAGTIRVNGAERANGAVHLTQRDTQLIFQDPQSALNPRRSVLRLLTQALEAGESYAPEAQRRPAAEALLRDTGLPPDCLERFPSQLSGGQTSGNPHCSIG